ncbi:arginase family protein [Bacillus mangrovi]|uniref:Arginase family protein n=1 Tax=Metabacillus mangrovi TaxID=1491830 RepID=A0A7X2S5A2_9BACI|nr:arginase family protein [Metabacillus mangrovi]MTH53882.1 arginase family protein [Metabacillus mangrovi]
MTKTIRMLMPQWQGGNNPHYSFGAELLAWLAPESNHPMIEVPVQPYSGTPLTNENGVYGRKQLLEQVKSARHLIDAHQPDRIVMFGGDCLVEQAPFAYLNERYGGELGLIWIDAHSDIMKIPGYDYGHTLPLGNLLGEGDEEFAAHVPVPLKPENVFIAGLAASTKEEGEVIAGTLAKMGIDIPDDSEILNRLAIKTAGAAELANSLESVKTWIKQAGIQHLAIHLDLDVLDSASFRSLLFANPESPYLVSPKGTMQISRLLELMDLLSAETNVVGLGITEHMPWDAINMKNMLERFPILAK